MVDVMEQVKTVPRVIIAIKNFNAKFQIFLYHTKLYIVKSFEGDENLVR